MFKLSACSVLTLRSGDKLEDIRVLSDKLLDCINLIKGKFNGVLVLAPAVYIHGPELPTRRFQLSSTVDRLAEATCMIGSRFNSI